MSEPPIKSTIHRQARDRTDANDYPATRTSNSLSMHTDVPVWYDCCSCEAEPYWIELVGREEKNSISKP